jgi:hypothetical protein
MMPRRLKPYHPPSEKYARERETVAEVDAILARERTRRVDGALYRCPGCGGKSPEPEGHPGCPARARRGWEF